MKATKQKKKKHEILNEFMTPDEMQQLSRDYVLEHEGIKILSFDYVIENGREWDDSIDYDEYGYKVCDVSGEEEGPFTGLLYQILQNGGWWYGYYEDGLEIRESVTFFGTGEVLEYHGLGRYYEWREDGNIRLARVRDEENLYLHIAKNGKVTRLTWSQVHSLHSFYVIQNGKYLDLD